MKDYLVKSPWWLHSLYPKLVWHKPVDEPLVYLTFDDGPTPEVTEWVLNQLAKHGAKATFFLIGKNVVEHPDIFKKTKDAGHSVGNHTHNHLNGWKHDTEAYLQNVQLCTEQVDSHLFRPPYGRVKYSQSKALRMDFDIIMWDVLTGDFDTSIDGEKCFQNLRKNVRPGSIIVFHDSVKAWPRLQYALPKTLEYLKEKGFRMEAL